MHRRSLLLAVAAMPSASPSAGASPPATVATFTILADIVKTIGRGSVRVTSLVGPDGDPHAYEPRPADVRAIAQARLLVENGLGLEGWIPRLFASGGFRGVRVTAANAVTPRTMTENGASSIDPHAWQDPRNGLLYVEAIATGLVQADPAGAATYRQAAEAYGAEIRATDAWIEQQYAGIAPRARRIITTHDAFGYYGARYGIELLAAEGLGTESEPSGRRIAGLLDQIRREKIRAVFLENMTDPRIAEMLARETGATLGGTVYSDALSPPGGPAPTYLRMLRHNTTLFVRAMQPG